MYSFIHSFAQQVTLVQRLVKTYCKISWTTRQTAYIVFHEIKTRNKNSCTCSMNIL